MLSSQKKMTINLISVQLSKSINLIQSWKKTKKNEENEYDYQK